MLQCPRCHRQFPDDVHVCSFDFTPLQADPTIAEDPVDPLIGRVFDEKYRLEERLGGGGMGTVYRATHLLIDRQVALKVLSQRFVGDETAQQRFRRERHHFFAARPGRHKMVTQQLTPKTEG